eukprot:CAMPEP_0183799310 /NCGR_PEP_ID=MMETSP0803_2-20130417/21249_1 /TAXON_ID=195967 /ORGANISM="Crustomastix stigmata, Strain CCMP3273" /LENGTH=107 /DNA_ID=CAMNT_0026044011 /DNA_START=35 /DNA_END=354 /DNA_ORIENTATION=-
MAAAPVLNAALVAACVPPSTLRASYESGGAGAVALVCVFALLWGLGGVGFGRAVLLLGVATGTSLVMGLVLTLGTSLPAVTEAGRLGAGEAAATAAGVVCSLAGFAL